MVHRLFRPVIRPRRGCVRDVWIERFVRNSDGREPQGIAHSARCLFRVDAVLLQVRGVSLPGAAPYPTFESLPERFTRHEFTTSKALTLREIRKTLISYEESHRCVLRGGGTFSPNSCYTSSISSLEMLDEVEELDLVLAHYAVTWGHKLPRGQQPSTPSKWIEWGLKVPTHGDHRDSDSD